MNVGGISARNSSSLHEMPKIVGEPMESGITKHMKIKHICDPEETAQVFLDARKIRGNFP
jgi:hypothetical protein